MAVAEQQLKERQEQELAGLDALETVVEPTAVVRGRGPGRCCGRS